MMGTGIAKKQSHWRKEEKKEGDIKGIGTRLVIILDQDILQSLDILNNIC